MYPDSIPIHAVTTIKDTTRKQMQPLITKHFRDIFLTRTRCYWRQKFEHYVWDFPETLKKKKNNSGIFCPNHFVLAGANNRNVIITYRFLASPVQANRDSIARRTFHFSFASICFLLTIRSTIFSLHALYLICRSYF